MLAACYDLNACSLHAAGTLPAWDPEGRQAGARVIVLPQQGAGFCGEVSWVALMTSSARVQASSAHAQLAAQRLGQRLQWAAAG